MLYPPACNQAPPRHQPAPHYTYTPSRVGDLTPTRVFRSSLQASVFSRVVLPEPEGLHTKCAWVQKPSPVQPCSSPLMAQCPNQCHLPGRSPPLTPA